MAEQPATKPGDRGRGKVMVALRADRPAPGELGGDLLAALLREPEIDLVRLRNLAGRLEPLGPVPRADPLPRDPNGAIGSGGQDPPEPLVPLRRPSLLGSPL